jgi:hypothetical protein
MSTEPGERCPSCQADWNTPPALELEAGLAEAGLAEPGPSALAWLRGRAGWIAAALVVVLVALEIGWGPLPVLLAGLAVLGLPWLLGALNPEHDLYDRLLAKAQGDRALVDRLIEAERQRRPGASRSAILRRVVKDWEWDRR